MLGGSTMSAANALQNLSGASSSSGMAVSSSYNSDRSSVQTGLDVEYANDAASGGFFNSDFKKHDDLRNMLDSNKDNLKLEAMKRIIGMVAKGRDASDLFPAVVKNVVSKNIEIKKLVYVYLVRYAEEQQDLALLSISTFQRALKDPNQLIRASALRVLSSIRVHCIVPIVMLAIKDSSADMSPYVRKTAAHAIPKLYSLDAEQKEELIKIIEKLLSDKTTLVVGSAVMAFEEVCPERVDLIHKNYRKLCNLLVDVDEWGQVIIINMLTRYARTQFTDPNADDDDGNENGDGGKDEKPFYEDSSASENESESKIHLNRNDKTYILDPDHRLLLRQTKPLLQSRNASVVMIVAQLYHHIAPRNEVNIVSKALIRLLRSHKEVQSVVLTNIASMSTQRKSIFEPYLKSFFVRTSDPTHIKLLKLEILTSLATAATISVILREFQTYISSNDKKFVAATIQAIGRCAASITEVTETCLSGLVHLLSNRDEYVVAESVVVIKNLLQTKAADHFEIISQMAKLIDFITVAAARASILWLIGEYCEKVPKIAPDVLRKMAKSFADEENIVKLQVLNLAVKLYLTNPEQTEMLCRYLFNLARYDENYDVRDRVRFLKPFIFPANGETVLSKQAKRVFLSAKPAPLLISQYSREQFQLGSLAHYLNARTIGYHDLPPFPKTAPDSSVRGVEIVVHDDSNNFDANESQHWENRSAKGTNKSNKKDKSFYTDSENENESSKGRRSDDDSSSDENSDEKSSSANSENDESDDESKSSGSGSESDGSDDGSDESSSEESSSDDTDSSESDEDSESSDEKNKVKVKPKENSKATTAPPPKAERSNLDLLLDLGDIAPTAPIMTPSLGGFLSPMSSSSIGVNLPMSTSSRFELVGPVHVSLDKRELLNKINSHGLQINYRFTRAPHLFSAKMVSIELTFHNESNNELENIHISNKSSLPANITICDFVTIAKLSPGQCVQGVLGVDFNDSTQPFTFEITSSAGSAKVSLKSSVGEMIRSVRVSESVFKEEQSRLCGMNEHICKINTKSTAIAIQQNIFETANLALIANKTNSDGDILQFAGQTMSSQSVVLVTVNRDASNGTSITVNCEKMVIGSMLLNEIKNSIKC
ncbi:AP-3 complex subunit beta-2 [Contarinia nasturtii]|uniref:AP-3 complex subunit beta-2 n=1 Tax=Contarinia nasturtii TaxID=265458 RepID=UPI0012D4B08C|nr:AP-3 complex subunit beta-2 [Contarinia nasturtii]XP_031638319.1 AP-3 complex subunit beta-2 [Contarinia nasturtii]